MSPTCRLVRSDQLAALALSFTTRLLSTTDPPPVVTVSVTPAACVAAELLPVTVIDVVSPESFAAVVTVIVESAPGATGLALNDAVAPAGSPDALSVTGPGLPASTAVWTANVAVPPAATVALDGAAPSAKSGPPTGGSGAWVQFSRPWNAVSRPALLTMLAGTWLPLVMVVLCATVTPLPVVVLGGFWMKLFSTSVGSSVVVAPGAKSWW